ncbi:MAG: ATP-binding protein [Candidatus Roizmanbacteria bacterium]|nr:ATP-binding protein [Candidatus Roizmanbacteria bacterium]
MIKRFYDDLSSYLKPGKVLIVQGPRQTGKTTLVQNNLRSMKQYKQIYLTGDSIEAKTIFSSQSLDTISSFAKNFDLIAIDEAQKIEGIGLGLKILVDHVPEIRVIATGSSSFDLVNKIGEPLVGRAIRLNLYPISIAELQTDGLNEYELQQKLQQYLLYGFYPEVITAETILQKKEYLHNLVDMYLLRDVLEFAGIKGSKFIVSLLKLLAFQVGNLVSLTELGQNLQANVRTIAKYLDLLEKSYIIKSLCGFSRNQRKEITKKNKYYFFDTGVRNALIGNFNELQVRNDVGALWENFLVMERLKKQEYTRLYANNYFWRTWDGQEVDWVEEREGKALGYEFTFSDKQAQKKKEPKDWKKAWSETSYEIITPENYLDFVT